MLHRLLRLLLAALWVAVFALAAWQRFRLPQTPHSDPDIWCYFNPSLSKLLGGPFQHTYGQCFLYPWLLYVVLAIGGDYRWITVVQHLLGLGTGALLLVAWSQARGFFPRPRLPRFVFDVAGLAMTGMYLLSSTSIRFEHTLRPEAVFPFFAVLNICAILAFVRRRFFPVAGIPPDRAPGMGLDWRTSALGAGAVFVCVMTWLLKPSFSAMLLLANLPVGLSLFLPGRPWRGKLTLALAATLAPALLLVLPEWRLRRTDPDAHPFLAVSLFTVHAGLIRDQMADDIAHRQTAPYDLQWLAEAHARLDQEIRSSVGTGHYLSLGYDPDYLKLETSFNGWLTKQAISPERAADFYDDYYRRAWRGRPLAMGQKIWRQMGVFYRFAACPAYHTYRKFDLQAAYADSLDGFDPGGPPFSATHPQPQSKRAVADRFPPAVEYFKQCNLLAQHPDLVATNSWVLAAAPWLSWTYSGLCAWALVVGAAAWLLPSVRRWSGPAVAVILFLYTYNFGTTLSLSIGHSMDIGRYSMYQLAYTLLPQGLSAWLALEAVLAVGAFLVVRAEASLVPRLKPLFAASPAPLPVLRHLEALSGLVRQEESPAVTLLAHRETVLGLLVRCPLADAEKMPGIIRYQQAFPEARLVSWGIAGEATKIFDCDVLLAIDCNNTSPDAVESAQRLIRSYADAPADLITVRTPAYREPFEPLAWLTQFAAGVKPADFRTGLRLLSRRFCRGVLLRVGHDQPTVQEEAMATAVQVANGRFLVHDLAVADGFALSVRTDETWPGNPTKPWLRAAYLFALCRRVCPVRSLGAVAGLCLLVAVAFAPFSMRHRPHARHRYMVRRAPMTVTGMMSAAAVASLATGTVLAWKRRRWQRAFLRTGNSLPMH